MRRVCSKLRNLRELTIPECVALRATIERLSYERKIYVLDRFKKRYEKQLVIEGREVTKEALKIFIAGPLFPLILFTTSRLEKECAKTERALAFFD